MLKRFLVTFRKKLFATLAGKTMSSSIADVDRIKIEVSALKGQVHKLKYENYQNSSKFIKYMHPDKYEEWLCDKYFEIYNKRLNFSNLKTFTEKMQWLKLYGADDLQTKLADKYLVKDYIKKHLGEKYVVPLLGVYDSFDEIDINRLPNSFVIKTNNASKANIIVKNKNDFDFETAEKQIDIWLQQSQFTYGLEMHYKNINPKIIVEKHLEFKAGVEDYKFYCFNGKPEYLLVIADRYTEEKMSFYDMNFIKQHFSILPGMQDLDVEEPDQYEEMLRLTKKLIKNLHYPFVRVDWYVDQFGKIYFGEFTFNPGAGWYFFKPNEFDRIWGDKIILPPQRNPVP